MENKIKIEINYHELEAVIFENDATAQLMSLLANMDLILNLEDFMQVEKLGDLGMPLPHKDRKVTANAGDLLLYMGSMFVLTYTKTEDKFVKLGRIENISENELRSIVGTGKCRVKLSMLKTINGGHYGENSCN